MHFPFILTVVAFASLNHAYPAAETPGTVTQTGSLTYEDLKFGDEYGRKLRNYEVKIENIDNKIKHEITFKDRGTEAKTELGHSVKTDEGSLLKWSFQPKYGQADKKNPVGVIYRFLVAKGGVVDPEEDPTDTLGTADKQAPADTTHDNATPDKNTPGAPNKATTVSFEAIDKELEKSVKKMSKQSKVTAVAGHFNVPWTDGQKEWEAGVEAH